MTGVCKWCQKNIFWEQTDAGFVPYEDEARTRIHDCPNKPQFVSMKTANATSILDTAKPLKIPPLTDREVLFLRKMVYFFEELQIR